MQVPHIRCQQAWKKICSRAPRYGFGLWKPWLPGFQFGSWQDLPRAVVVVVSCQAERALCMERAEAPVQSCVQAFDTKALKPQHRCHLVVQMFFSTVLEPETRRGFYDKAVGVRLGGERMDDCLLNCKCIKLRASSVAKLLEGLPDILWVNLLVSSGVDHPWGRRCVSLYRPQHASWCRYLSDGNYFEPLELCD